MKEKLSRFLALMICFISFLGVSCQHEVEENYTSEFNETEDQFILKLNGNITSFMNSAIVSSDSVKNQITKSITTPHNVPIRELYIDLSVTDEPIVLDSIKTPLQILNLVKKTGAEISLIDDGTFTHSLSISEEESLLALNPLIQESKIYLYNKGFTESEIQQMLKENDVDESALVPFVLLLTEEEEYQKSILLDPSSLMTRNVDLNRAGRCAINALFDALAGFAQSTAKTWSKAVLKTVFKTVATKMVGPVGVAIAVIDFSLCYWG